MNESNHLQVGVGGPVGSGKTALIESICKTLRDDYSIAVVTNDICTREDAEFLTRKEALAAERIAGVDMPGSFILSPCGSYRTGTMNLFSGANTYNSPFSCLSRSGK